ncbi:MAG: hypothetical protein KJ970_20255 [Candidatus Eisenbacteria bacterium]|uniref:Fibronectin type-III domain-containing protein n=1 Tax=Eiseniibacteriota bacterium TaxID=2212470 RepID=A0A948S0W5_UNCEI|nr:hypothetical protein [Candidatus Eisenbacteria bacterium]MBU1950688.1 hypothetical protein [Candidatus Eisenbacteria bacterium]MBU2693257.1 hypothetical protein [Candidatus Eisenbacteria bacterium]
MKKLLMMVVLLMMVGFMGCDDTTTTVVAPEDLAPPLGLYSITGDEEVTLFWWCSNYDDLVGYKVYFISGPYGGGADPREEVPNGFEVVDSLSVTPPCSELKSIVIDGLTNGETYHFLVVAAKDNWSDISYTSNIIADTPRPESGTTITLYAKQAEPTLAGLEVSSFERVDCTSLDSNYDTPGGSGDIMVERFNPGAGVRAWIDGINSGWIQDIGYMQDWDDADEAPETGYADAGHSIEALMGHVYAIWTGDNHFAKIQVTDIEPSFEWIKVKAAYQPAVGEREYK